VDARVLWTFSVGGAVTGPVLFENGKLYFGSFDSKVYALDVAARAQNREGTELVPSSEWSFDTGNWVWAKPLSHEGVLYVSNLGGRVYALDLETGQTVWPAPAEVGGQILGQPAVINNTRGPSLAVPSGDEDVVIVVIANGQVAGRFDTSGNGVKSDPVLVGERLFVHSVNGELRVFNTSTLRQETCVQPRGDGDPC
jgi:outer membrane protein assembly factor BamB